MDRTPDPGPNAEPIVSASPVPATERLSALDTLRGFALLGILLMNIVGFAFHSGAYDNPTVAGGDTGLNLWVWFVLHVLAEGKMRCLFSLVFGASAVLLASRLGRRSSEAGPDGADIYYRRNLWLLGFGILHSYLLWQGEILYPYAVIAFALYPFRRMSPRGITGFATALILYCAVFYTIDAWKLSGTIRAGREAVAKEQSGATLTAEETEARDAWDAFRKDRNPDADALAKDAAEWRGTPWQVIQARGAVVVHYWSIPWYHPWLMESLAMMLLGMALMKWGVLGGARSGRFYGAMATGGYLVGLPLHTYNGWVTMKSGFDPVVQGYAGAVYDLGRLAVACGHAGLLLWICRNGWLRGATGRLAAVGQMALSNYLTHSVVCAFVFTGYGLGLYGRLERYQVYGVVLVLWVFQLWASPIWLRRFRFGPAEWAWRSLTYWKLQPMRRA